MPALALDQPKFETKELAHLQAVFLQTTQQELGSPISILQEYARLLTNENLGKLTANQQVALEIMIGRANHLKKMLDRLTVLMTLNNRSVCIQPFNLPDLLAELTPCWHSISAQAGLEFDLQYTSSLPPLKGYYAGLLHAVDCLLENAVKFTPEGGRIEIEVAVEPRWICLTVADTGIGIEAEKLEYLFTLPFYQVDGSTTRRYGGMGLGLTLVKMVVEAHAGQVVVESAPHQGSRFTLQLPTAA